MDFILAIVLFLGTAIFLNTIFVLIYNHYLSMMHESVIKKVVALAGLPSGTILAFILTWIFFVQADAGLLTVFLILLCLGGWFVFFKRQQIIFQQKKNNWWNGKVDVRKFPNPVDYSSISPMYRPILKMLSPINDVGHLTIHEGDLELSNLPDAFDGYRVLHITDFHLHNTLRMEWFEFVISEIDRLEPDLVLFGGDMISKYPHVDHVAPYLKKIKAPDGVLFVRGNHDFWKAPHRLKRHVEAAGFKLLSNDSFSISKGEDRLNFIGLETPYISLTKIEKRKLSSVPNPKIALVHTPESYRDAKAVGADIALAGHTHGGQVRLPFFGTTICGCGVEYRFADGRSKMGKMKTWTSRGVGAFFPFRFRCAPEMIVLKLKKKSSKRKTDR